MVSARREGVKGRIVVLTPATRMNLNGRAGSRRIARSEWTTQRWKNGAGITHEIFRWSAIASVEGYDLRLSVAEVEGAQPFSSFPGYFRSLVVLEETTLRLGGQPMTKGRVFDFRGDLPMATTGEGRATDLNVISRLEGRARVEVASRESKPEPRALAVFALEPVVLRGGVERALGAGDTWIDLAGDAAYVATAPVVWVRFG